MTYHNNFLMTYHDNFLLAYKIEENKYEIHLFFKKISFHTEHVQTHPSFCSILFWREILADFRIR